MFDDATFAPTLAGPLAEAHAPAPLRPLAHKTAVRRASANAQPAPLYTLTGVLQADAEWRVTAGARAVGMIIVRIDQPGLACIRATQVVGTDPLAHVAGSAKAHRLCAGTVVQVQGSTLVGHPSGRSIELLGVSDLREHRLPDLDARICPAPRAAAAADHDDPWQAA